mgnify:CR=1 FL=1
MTNKEVLMATQKEEQDILKKLEKLAVHNDPINPDLYTKYDVKRGLRNANGTGVLVGAGLDFVNHAGIVVVNDSAVQAHIA